MSQRTLTTVALRTAVPQQTGSANSQTTAVGGGLPGLRCRNRAGSPHHTRGPRTARSAVRLGGQASPNVLWETPRGRVTWLGVAHGRPGSSDLLRGRAGCGVDMARWTRAALLGPEDSAVKEQANSVRTGGRGQRAARAQGHQSHPSCCSAVCERSSFPDSFTLSCAEGFVDRSSWSVQESTG